MSLWPSGINRCHPGNGLSLGCFFWVRQSDSGSYLLSRPVVPLSGFNLISMGLTSIFRQLGLSVCSAGSPSCQGRFPKEAFALSLARKAWGVAWDSGHQPPGWS